MAILNHISERFGVGVLQEKFAYRANVVLSVIADDGKSTRIILNQLLTREQALQLGTLISIDSSLERFSRFVSNVIKPKAKKKIDKDGKPKKQGQ